MAYKHGVYTSEVATSLVAPIEGTAGLMVVVGTAPVNMLADPAGAVNKPLLVHSYKEAVEAVGYVPDFAKYTLCEAISAAFSVVSVAPMVLINVLDPAKHTTAIEDTPIQINDGVAVLEKVGALLDKLVVKADGTTDLTAGEDYTTSWNEDGTLNIVVLPDGKGDEATSLTVSGSQLDPSKVKASDIVGGVDVSSGKETGLEVIRQVYPLLGMTPGILVAPRHSMDATVAAALQAKTKDINSVYKAVCVVDIKSDTGGATRYTDVKTTKEAQAVSDPNAYAVWLYGKVGEVVYSGSILAAALTAYTDAVNDDTPNVSPSNKTIAISAACLPDGTEVVLDQEQANVVNSYGVATWLNMNGFRLWGNNTAAYPGNTDHKDRWFSVRRFLNWAANSFILTYFQKVDSPANKRLIEAIVDSENVRGNGVAASVTLPEINMKSSTVSGVGVSGEIDSPTIGQFESMEQEIQFNTLYSSAMDMLSPLSTVNLTFRAAQQVYDKTGGYNFKGLRVVEMGRVKKFNPGKIEKGEAMEATVTLELTYIMVEVDGSVLLEADKLNGVYKVNGVDMLAGVNELI